MLRRHCRIRKVFVQCSFENLCMPMVSCAWSEDHGESEQSMREVDKVCVCER